MASHHHNSRLTGHVRAGRKLDGIVDNYSDRSLCLHAMSKPQQFGQTSTSAIPKTFNDENVVLRLHEYETTQRREKDGKTIP